MIGPADERPDVTTTQADLLWRAVVYLAVAMIHLKQVPLETARLSRSEIKQRPSGHWGTVPGSAWALVHTSLLAKRMQMEGKGELIPLLGTGHAGIVQLAASYLSGDLSRLRPAFDLTATGMNRLFASFPEMDGLGAEVRPDMVAGASPGGCLGGTLAFAQGMAIGSPGRVTVPILGDGECETPTTAAAWLAGRALPEAMVVPVVHLNGFRMGGPSLLGGMTDEELIAYAAGLGYAARIVPVDHGSLAEHERFQEALEAAVTETQAGSKQMLYLRCMKGWSAPAYLAGRQILGTAEAHKTPFARSPWDDESVHALGAWLGSYRPCQLFGPDGTPLPELADAVRAAALGPYAAIASAPAPEASASWGAIDCNFGSIVSDVLEKHAAAGDFRVFSPDELASNRLGTLAGREWVTEVLAEEVLMGWLAGWSWSGRRGVLISYEAFAPLLLAGLVSQLKHRRLHLGHRAPSLNLLLTSYGWHNTYTHGDPSLITALLALQDPHVKVFTPADPARTGIVLDHILGSTGHVNVILAGKHTQECHPTEARVLELAQGLNVWPHLSDEGEPDLTLVVAGDLPAEIAHKAAEVIRQAYACRVRVVNTTELTAFATLTRSDLQALLGSHSAVLVATLGHSSAMWGLLAGKVQRPTEIIGWVEAPHPLPQNKLAQRAGLTVTGLAAAAGRLLAMKAAL